MSVESGERGLELLTAGEPSRLPPLLFVHGAFCGGWVWAEHFLPYFAERGWRCIALSLRGHGRSPGHKQLDLLGLADYVADVAMVAAGLEEPPIVVGHSMGGIVAQRFVCKHKASGLALMAPAGLSGLAGSAALMALGQPALLGALGRVQSRSMSAADFDAIRKGLFSRDFPADLALRYLPMFQRESLRVNFELIGPQWFYLMPRPRLPVLALGGAEDRFIPTADLRATALFWGAELHVLEGVPHALMLDTSWRRAADVLADWLERSFGKARSGVKEAPAEV